MPSGPIVQAASSACSSGGTFWEVFSALVSATPLLPPPLLVVEYRRRVRKKLVRQASAAVAKTPITIPAMAPPPSAPGAGPVEPPSPGGGVGVGEGVGVGMGVGVAVCAVVCRSGVMLNANEVADGEAELRTEKVPFMASMEALSSGFGAVLKQTLIAPGCCVHLCLPTQHTHRSVSQASPP